MENDKETSLREGYAPFVGCGYDAHRLVEGRPLVLGGVVIPHAKGLLGHSDADVLTHAVIDALIGAAGLGDIGRLFPPTDAAYKDISSIELLAKIRGLLDAQGFTTVNVDSTIVCESPRLSNHTPAMIKNISGALKIASGRVNVKAKTEEGMGFTGSGEGISAHAVALIGVLK
ncbi:MAG: 2-C-methyl-D-erythritol 2,4-cyclodiphosphate synthase [Deltaproteobacteria bacterium]|nr:2-C-methyl-D-erythritol 2,4-cyclodiphosphate synthase [Deltaproteobacteria bacterium]